MICCDYIRIHYNVLLLCEINVIDLSGQGTLIINPVFAGIWVGALPHGEKKLLISETQHNRKNQYFAFIGLRLKKGKEKTEALLGNHKPL